MHNKASLWLEEGLVEGERNDGNQQSNPRSESDITSDHKFKTPDNFREVLWNESGLLVTVSSIFIHKLVDKLDDKQFTVDLSGAFDIVLEKHPMFTTKLWDFLINKSGTSHEDQHDFCMEITKQPGEIDPSCHQENRKISDQESLVTSKTQPTPPTSTNGLDTVGPEQSTAPTATSGQEGVDGITGQGEG